MVKEILAQVSAERIRAHIQALEGIRHPVAAPEALERAADYILAAFQRLDYQVEAQSFIFSENGRTYRNLAATRRGGAEPDERWLVIAHYDTVAESPGANDNASGVAVLLELARVLEPLALRRTVQFIAVCLEERQKEGGLEEAGLFGSRALVSQAKLEDWKIGGAIVLDTVGCAGDEILQQTPAGLPVQLPEKGNFIGVIGNTASQGLVQRFMQAVEQYQFALPVTPFVVPGRGEMLPDTRRSDHVPFWDQGYPAIMLTDTANFRYPHYHQPTDTLEKVNLSFVAEVCRVVTAMVADAASWSSYGP
jgi:Zn-dependent M28 family amino/carboxypeptidase